MERYIPKNIDFKYPFWILQRMQNYSFLLIPKVVVLKTVKTKEKFEPMTLLINLVIIKFNSSYYSLFVSSLFIYSK